MNRYGDFYRSLWEGSRQPTTNAQKEFIKNIRNKKATNAHESAFLAYLGWKKPTRSSKTTRKAAPRSKKKSDYPERPSLNYLTKPPEKSYVQPTQSQQVTSDKPNYDRLATGKAHGDPKTRQRNRALDRYGRPSDE